MMKISAFLGIAGILGLASSIVVPETLSQAGGAFAAQAAPQPTRPVWASLTCKRGERYAWVQHGLDDTFVEPVNDPPPTPVPLWTYPPEGTNKYDSTAVNYHFADTLSFTQFPGETLTAARFTTRLRSNGDFPSNDIIGFSSTSATGTTNTYGGTYVPASGGLATYDMTSNGVVPGQPAGPGPGPNGPWSDSGSTAIGRMATGSTTQSTDPLGDLNINHALNVFIEDDQSVDFTGLELCFETTQKPYDIGVTKIRDGNLYQIRVVNLGKPISPPAKIEVTEMVPFGMTVTAMSIPPGWTCTPGAPVIGPDAIVCTYMVTGTIATGQALPPIGLKTIGKGRCMNCVRAKLYMPYMLPPRGEEAPQAGPRPPPMPWQLVHEPNEDNNVDCVK